MTGRWYVAAGVALAAVFTAVPTAFASGWKVVPTSNPSASQNSLAGVARVPGTDTFWAGGWTDTANGVSNGLIERWNGSQ